MSNINHYDKDIPGNSPIRVVISRDGDGALVMWQIDAKIKKRTAGNGGRATARWFCKDPLEFDGSTSTDGCLGSLQINQKGTFELRRVEEKKR